ncbi:MAG: serine/threonine protein kinase [Bulleidia sp.]
MDYSQQVALTYYKTIATLNEAHNIYLVQHQETKKIYVKKIIDVYNIDVYKKLENLPLSGVPKIRELFETDNRLTVIESYVSGTSFEDVINNNNLTLTSLVNYLTELCDILNQLHQLNPPIIHRDIKPSNIIITENNHVVLLDFNAAKFYSDTSSNDTVLLGTKGYAAPEQYGFGSSSPQTDIYALGILMKEAFEHMNNIPVGLLSVAEKCIQLDPKERYDSVSHLSMDIQSAYMPQANTTSGFTASQILPPGFRSHTAWKMLISIPAYIVILWLSLTLEVENANGSELWIQRIFCLLMFLSIVGGTCNYLNIHEQFPLCRHKKPYIRVFGILLLDIVLVATLFFIMLIILAFFRSN